MKLLNEATEPPVYTVVNASGAADLLLVCDHASARVPLALGGLGLTPEQLADHIGWDAGAAAVAQRLAVLLDAPLIQTNYSRLVIDCNRDADSDQSILERSDDIIIPGNRNLTATARLQRQQTLHAPYHQAITEHLNRRGTADTVLLSIHSFTPVLAGRLRPWSIGVCSGADRRLADPLLRLLRGVLDSGVGDNQPYAIETGVDFTLPFHAAQRGLRHVMLEISRDQLDGAAGIERWAQRLSDIWRQLMAG